MKAAERGALESTGQACTPRCLYIPGKRSSSSQKRATEANQQGLLKDFSSCKPTLYP